jgi:hypothetical protein
MNIIEKGAGMKIFLLVIVSLLLLTACGPSREEMMITVTSEWATADAERTAWFETQTAGPSRTPPPIVATPTLDKRSPVDKCASSGIGIRYVISGNGVTGVSLTWNNDTNGTEQGDYKIPFCKTFMDFKSGDFLYISAQIIQPTSNAGSIQCIIYDGDSVVSKASASGFPSIATCEGTAK